ncbi:MAG: ATP synthase F1 subunit delta [Deltaproteobacteria bacterium]|nr:ATP synthase F1 subunit delta [Deltaproteobacteria bacterium]
MENGSLARRYARALTLLVKEEGTLESSVQEIQKLASIFHSHQELLKTLGESAYPLAERQALLGEIADRLALSVPVRHFMFLLLDKNRIFAFHEIEREIERLQDEILGIVRVEVTSPSPLSKDFLKRAEQFVAQKTKKKPIFQEKIDPSLIGGVVLRQGGILYDGSVRTEIRKLKDELMGSH